MGFGWPDPSRQGETVRVAGLQREGGPGAVTESQVCILPLWELGQVTRPLSLSFLICKIGQYLDLLCRVSVRVKGVKAGQVLGVVLGTQEGQGHCNRPPLWGNSMQYCCRGSPRGSSVAALCSGGADSLHGLPADLASLPAQV